MASLSEKPVEQRHNVPPFEEVIFVDLIAKDDGESIANTNPPSTMDDIQFAEDSSLGN